MERYFPKLPKGTHLSAYLTAPSPKRPKRGPGHPRKAQLTIARIDDSDRSTDSSPHSDESSDEAVTISNSNAIHNVDKMTQQ